MNTAPYALPTITRMRRLKMLVTLSASVSALALAASEALTRPAEPQEAQPKADASPAPLAKAGPAARVWTTRHEMKIGGTVLSYTATAGTMRITNDKDEPLALFGFTAYVKNGADPRSRDRRGIKLGSPRPQPGGKIAIREDGAV